MSFIHNRTRGRRRSYRGARKYRIRRLAKPSRRQASLIGPLELHLKRTPSSTIRQPSDRILV
jgi:hypothetical protein